MADIGYVRSLLGSIPDTTTKSVLQRVFEHVLANIRLGVPEHQTRATNLQAYWMTATTPAVANQEFSIAHGLQATPHYAIPVLELDRPGAQTVPLEVTRAADKSRIYLRSTSTSAPIALL